MYDNRFVSETPELLVADAARWRAWLAANHATSRGVRLVLARKGASAPTRLIYDDALPEALCYGWIDGHLTRRRQGHVPGSVHAPAAAQFVVTAQRRDG